MNEYKSRYNWFQVEEKEHILNLQCEKKFAYFVFLSQIEGVFSIQEDGLYPSHSEVSNDLTPMILSKYKGNVKIN